MSAGNRRPKTQGEAPSRAAVRARRALKRLARPAGAFDASRYFRGAGDLGFYNVGTSDIRALARSIHAAHRHEWSVNDAIRFADVLIRDRYLDVKLLGIDVVARYRRDFSPRLLPVWKRWLADGHAANWATTDAICGSLIGQLLVQHPTLAGTVSRWATHRSLWVRRASAVGLLPAVRRGLPLDPVYAVARTLHADEADLIQKAVGWMLREAGKVDAARLERYLVQHGRIIPRTTLRYAIERMPQVTRRRLLTVTRPSRSTARTAQGKHTA